MIPVKQALGSVHFLRNLDDGVMDEIVQKCTEKVYLKNETLFLEGDPPKGLIVVREGAIKIYKTGDTGR